MRLLAVISRKRPNRAIERLFRDWEEWKKEHPVSHVRVVGRVYDWEVDGE